MPGIIELRDKDSDGFLTVELRDLLPFLETEGRQLIWSILDLEATGDPQKLKRNLLEIEQEARQSPHGFTLDWTELVALVESLDDVLDAVIVGCRGKESIPNLTSDREIYASCEIVIEAIDSSLWRIYAKNDEIIQKLRAAFNDVNVTAM